jgi:hypothetical protein
MDMKGDDLKVNDDPESEKNWQRTCDMENFKIVAEHFRQDVREFWTRANFFLLAQTALFSAFVAVYPSLISEQIVVGIVVPVFGMALAIFWYFVLRGAVFWIEQWRNQMIKLSKELDRFQCYAEIETLVNKRRFQSPSYLTQFLPLGFVAVWLMMLVLVILKVFVGQNLFCFHTCIVKI